MRARITPDDLAAGQLVEPGVWYRAKIVSYREEPASTDSSTNGVVVAKILWSDKNQDKFKGARFRAGQFNEKAMGYAAPLLKALGAKVDKEKGIDADLSEETLGLPNNGKEFDVLIRRGETSKKNPFNEAVEFAPAGTVVRTYKGEVGGAPAA